MADIIIAVARPGEIAGVDYAALQQAAGGAPADPGRLGDVLRRSSLVVSARDSSGHICGAARGVCDFATTCHIEDVVVAPAAPPGLPQQLVEHCRSAASRHFHQGGAGIPHFSVRGAVPQPPLLGVARHRLAGYDCHEAAGLLAATAQAQAPPSAASDGTLSSNSSFGTAGGTRYAVEPRLGDRELAAVALGPAVPPPFAATPEQRQQYAACIRDGTSWWVTARRNAPASPLLAAARCLCDGGGWCAVPLLFVAPTVADPGVVATLLRCVVASGGGQCTVAASIAVPPAGEVGEGLIAHGLAAAGYEPLP